MKILFSGLLASMVLVSCFESNKNKELLGEWKSIGSSNSIEFYFSQDFFISKSWGKTTRFSWKRDDYKIYYTQLTNLDSNLKVDYVMEYRLSSEKDTLFLKNSGSINKFVRK